MIMMQKIAYFKLIICIIIILLLPNTANAQNWVKSNNEIYIDMDSIASKDDSLYYKIKYFEKKANEDLIVIIQSKGDYVGIVSTCKISDYIENPIDDITQKQAKRMKLLNKESSLYETNIIAQKRDTNNNVDFGPYMRELQRRIKMNWEPPQGSESKQIVLLFKIAKDGRLLSCSVLKSSGSQKSDNAALNAVRLTAPFRPLPADFKGQSVNIQFTFSYNVFGARKEN